MMNYLKSMLYSFAIILIGTVILTFLNYFEILNGIVLKVIMLIIPLLGVIVGSFLIGSKCNQKGYIEGIKYGGIWILFLLIFNFITNNFHITSIIFYMVLLLMSIGAGVLGINKRKN